MLRRRRTISTSGVGLSLSMLLNGVCEVAAKDFSLLLTNATILAGSLFSGEANRDGGHVPAMQDCAVCTKFKNLGTFGI